MKFKRSFRCYTSNSKLGGISTRDTKDVSPMNTAVSVWIVVLDGDRSFFVCIVVVTNPVVTVRHFIAGSDGIAEGILLVVEACVHDRDGDALAFDACCV